MPPSPSTGVVLAAGSGVRLMPLTATRPKPMLPIAGKPLLQYNLEQLAAAGVREIIIIISPNGKPIERHFGDRFGDASLRYIVQAEARGTGHAVRLAREATGREAFLCIFGDNLTAWPVTRLLPAHRSSLGPRPGDLTKGQPVATMALFHARDPRRHGVVELSGRAICRIVEKPEHPPSDLASAGMFIFEPEIFDALAATAPAASGEVQLPDALELLIAGGRAVAYAVLDEWRLNINTPQDLLEANRHLLQRCAGTACRTVGREGVAPPVVAADEPRIARGACLGPYVSCGKRCIIEAGARVCDSILLDDVTVSAHAQVEGCVIGEGARVAPGVAACNRVVADGEICR
jgi:glucose-1-phosphate thymidylyltransferase